MYVMRKSTFVKSKTAKLLVEQVYGQIKHSRTARVAGGAGL